MRVLLPKWRSSPASSHFVIPGPRKAEEGVSCTIGRGCCQRSKIDYLQSADIIVPYPPPSHGSQPISPSNYLITILIFKYTIDPMEFSVLRVQQA